MFDRDRPLMPYYCTAIPEGVWIHPVTGETYLSNRAISSLLEIDLDAVESFTAYQSTGLYMVEPVETEEGTTLRSGRLYSINTVLAVVIEYRFEYFVTVGLCGMLPIIYTMVGFAGIPNYLSKSPDTQTFESTVEFLTNNDTARKYVQRRAAHYFRRQLK
jgi:hypothetical protein